MSKDNNLQGSLINASKLVGVLNRLAGSGGMLAWYQDKPIEVLNRLAGSGAVSGNEIWLMHH